MPEIKYVKLVTVMSKKHQFGQIAIGVDNVIRLNDIFIGAVEGDTLIISALGLENYINEKKVRES